MVKDAHSGRWFMAVTVLMLLPACSLLRAPKRMVTAVVPGTQPKQVDPVDQQVAVQRLADHYSAQMAGALDEYVGRIGTDPARVQALQWKLSGSSAAFNIASGPQPKANLLDLVSLVVQSRAAVEQYTKTNTDPTATQPWVQACRSLESNAWEVAGGMFTPAQMTELREAIRQSQPEDTSLGSVFAARPQEFASLVKSSQKKQKDVNSVFSLVGLDPTAGLDPAVHEITLTRLFAERAMFALQRMPLLVRWQAELLASRVTDQPDVRLVLTNLSRLGDSMERVSLAAESASQTAAQLPDRIATERKAILIALEQQAGELRGLAAQIDQALVSADKMSASLSVAITNFDALMKRFGVGEPTRKAAPDTNSPPFRILDYGETATQIAGMANELNALLTSVNASVPQVERLSRQTSAEAQRVTDRLFRQGLVLIGALLVGAVAAGLTYRILAEWMQRRSQPVLAIRDELERR